MSEESLELMLDEDFKAWEAPQGDDDLALLLEEGLDSGSFDTPEFEDPNAAKAASKSLDVDLSEYVAEDFDPFISASPLESPKSPTLGNPSTPEKTSAFSEPLEEEEIPLGLPLGPGTVSSEPPRRRRAAKPNSLASQTLNPKSPSHNASSLSLQSRQPPTLSPPVSDILPDLDPDLEAILRSGMEEIDSLRAVESKPPPKTAEPTLSELMEEAKVRQRTGDFSGSLELFEEVLLIDAQNVEAQHFLKENTQRLLEMCRSKLGNSQRIPKIMVSSAELIWQSMNHRAGFLLSQIDGHTSTEDIIEIAGMPELEASRYLLRFLKQELIRF